MKEYKIENQGYTELFQGIVKQIHSSRIKAASEANRMLGMMYYNIGKIITDNQQKFGWGKSVVEKLSLDLIESIGILLCAEKDNLEVEYSLKVAKNPIGVAEYQLTKQLPKHFVGQLPSVKELTEKAKELIFRNENIDQSQNG